MNNDIELPDPEETKLDPSIATDAKIGNEGKIVLGIIAAVCVVICLCAVLCIGTGVFGIGSVVKEKTPIKAVLNTFMEDLESNDFDEAYALFSPRAQRQTTVDDIRRMRSGINEVLFQSYEGLRINNFNIESSVNADVDQPQGVVATVSGKLLYESGASGEFEAILEKVDGEWKLYSMDLWIEKPDRSFDDVSV
jgi:hypothetical protein